MSFDRVRTRVPFTNSRGYFTRNAVIPFQICNFHGLTLLTRGFELTVDGMFKFGIWLSQCCGAIESNIEVLQRKVGQSRKPCKWDISPISPQRRQFQSGRKSFTWHIDPSADLQAKVSPLPLVKVLKISFDSSSTSRAELWMINVHRACFLFRCMKGRHEICFSVIFEMIMQ